MGAISFRVSAAVCAMAVAPAVASAATDADVESLRSQLAQMKAEYEQRIAALEAEVQELQTNPGVGATAAVNQQDAAAAAAATQAPSAVAAVPPEVVPPSMSKPTAFNPAISLILTGNYANLSRNPDNYAIQGFIPAGDGVGPGDRSFNLGESELTIASNVDPYFMGNLTASITSDNEIEVEEAYFRTIALPFGFNVKAGQYLSSVGYLNDVHSHAWDFVDLPLVYQAFFNGQMAVQGVQAQWVAPLDSVLMEFGVESGNGHYYPGTGLTRNGLNGYDAYVHVGGDLGDATAWRTGLSYVDLHADDREFAEPNPAGGDSTSAFTGGSTTWIVDAELKWTPIQNPDGKYLKVQGEYMQRKEDGRLSYLYDVNDLSGSYSSDQSGWYVQAVYRFLREWRFGARYDSMDSGRTKIGLVQDGQLSPEKFPLLLPGSPSRTSLMVDWSPTEFSRLRLQYAWDDASQGPTDDQLYLQYIMAIGAHGAHNF
jgi:hypothetical protein